MEKKTLIAALVETANELDVLGMGAEADAITRIATNLMSGKRLASPNPFLTEQDDPTHGLPSLTTEDEWDGDGNEWDESSDPSGGMDDAVSGAFPNPRGEDAPLSTGSLGSGVQEQASEADDRQSEMSEIALQIRALSDDAKRLRNKPDDLHAQEQADEAEEMIAELESNLYDLAGSHHVNDVHDNFGEDAFDENDPYGDASMGSEPLFHDQKRVPYNDDLAGGKGTRLFK